MKTLNTFQFQNSKSLLLLIAIFLLVIAAGCSDKKTAIVERVSNGLELRVDSKGMSLTLPSCDTNNFSDRFLLHIYTDDYDNSPTKYIHKDFDLTKEKGNEIVSNGKRKCVFNKNFGDLAVTALEVGQFTTPNGKCCNITWSRTYLFGASPQDK